MKKLPLLTVLTVIALTSCKKPYVCQCKAVTAGLEDFKYDIPKTTKKDAKKRCTAEDEFWAPDWDCTLN